MNSKKTLAPSSPATAPSPLEPTAKPNQGPGAKRGPGGKKGPGQRQRPIAVQVLPAATNAKLKKRHYGLLTSFLLLVIAPLLAASIYLWVFASDQYASTTGFTIRQEEGGGTSSLLTGIAAFAGGGGTGAADADVLYEFIRSQEIVQIIDQRVNFDQIYATNWSQDPLFSLSPDSSIEDKLEYWQRMVRISYDQGTGLIELRVLAFTPDDARMVAREIVTESQEMINALNAVVREDTMRYAINDLEEALQRLKEARQALVQFRTETQIVDPEADIQGRMGVVNSLQQQLAQALIEHDLIAATVTRDDDPRLLQAARMILVIRQRIESERNTFVQSGVVAGGGDYPTLIADFENLMVEKEFAEETYSFALTAFELARSSAVRQSRYLTPYIRPTLAQSAEFPQRETIFVLLAFFLVLAWSIMALVYYSIRDRR